MVQRRLGVHIIVNGTARANVWKIKLKLQKSCVSVGKITEGDGGMARPRKESGEKCMRKDVSFEPEQYQKLIAYCQKEERSISWVIRKALEVFLCSDT